MKTENTGPEALSAENEHLRKQVAALQEANWSLQRQISEREKTEQELAHFRKRMAEALQLKEERYALATEAGKVGVWDWNVQTDEVYLDSNLKALLGYAPHEIKDRIEAWAKHIHPDDLEQVKENLRTHLHGEKTEYEFAHRLLHKDGGIRWFITRGYVMRDATGRPSRMIGANTDITDLKQAQEIQEQLRQRNVRAAAIAEAEENERRRISRELHDGLGQILTGIKFNFETFERMLGAQNRDERQRFTEIKELLNNAIIEVQRISQNLTPRTLDDFGLVPALEFLCRQVAQHSGVKVEFGAHNLAERLGANLEIGLFRIAQEALNNIAKHAGAASANLNIARRAATLTLCIEDDGKGFLYDDNPHAEPREHGMGMINMRERAEALNGALTIESQPGRGTKIIIELPLN